MQVREKVLSVESVAYYSIELRGPLLPTALHSLLRLLRARAAAPVSAAFAHHVPSRAFAVAARVLAQGLNLTTSVVLELYYVSKEASKKRA